MIPRRVAAILLALILCAGLVRPATGAPQGVASAGKDHLYFNAWDTRQKRYVTDLKAEEIRLTENGGQQIIGSLRAAREEPLVFGLLFDASGSRVQQLPGAERIPAKEFAKRVLLNGSRGFVATFDEDIRAKSDFTSSADALASEIEKVFRIPPKAGSAFYDSISSCVPLFPGGQARQVLIVVSDGVDNASRNPAQIALDDLASELPKYNLTVFVVLINNGLSRRSSVRAIASARRLTQVTGGKHFIVWDHKEMQQAFEEIAGQLETQYVVDYDPNPPLIPGKFRKTKWAVARPGVKVLARPGYYPAP